VKQAYIKGSGRKEDVIWLAGRGPWLIRGGRKCRIKNSKMKIDKAVKS
jgi:hypothetical protein